MNHLPLEYNCKFIETLDISPFFFKDTRDIKKEYTERGFKKVAVVPALDKGGNILGDVFCVLCHIEKKDYTYVTSNGFLRRQ